MVTLTIDGKQVTAPKTATIYEAAKAAGIKIPILCHDKKLHPFGACRMCLVEVEQMKGRQIPACTTPVTEGMIVTTSTEEIIKARELVLELLLLNHPIDCPVCDKAGDCDLQNLTYEYEVERNRFQDEKFHHEIDYTNPLIERDMNRCILCGKCSRICDEIVSFGAYTFINRGIETKMGTEFDGPLNCEFCGSCVSVCPVGALLARPFKFKARWWALKKVKSVCSYCGTGCNMTLGIKDNKVLTTIYDENQGFHNGQLCVRGRFGYQFVNHEKRLTTPLIRKNGNLVEASWEEALGLVKEKLAEGKTNPSAVAGLVTPRLTNEELLLLKKLFQTVGSDNLDHAAGYAHAALSIGAKESLGVAASPSTFADIQKTDYLLVIKTDAYETHPVVGFEINLGVKRQGVSINILSDKKGKLSRLPGAKTVVHKPGAEAAVLAAMTKVILEEGLNVPEAAAITGFDALKQSIAAVSLSEAAKQAGLTAEDIQTLARDYAKAEKSLIVLPLGQGYLGHDAKLAQAVINLAVLTGKIGKEGSGVLLLGEKNNSQGAVDLGIYPTSGKGAKDIIAAAAAGEVSTLYIVGENPVVSYPGRKKVEAALDKAGFVIVQDLFLTETAAKADVVLPAASFAEKEGTFTSAERKVQHVRQAIKPVGQAKADFDIFSMLISALGGETIESPRAAFAEITKSVSEYAGLTLEGLGEVGSVWPVQTKPVLKPVALTAVKEGSGVALLTGSSLYHCGTMSNYGKGPVHVCPDPYVELNTADAVSIKVAADDVVTIKSGSGEIRLKAKISHRVPQGVAFAPYHFGEQSVNTIVDGEPVTWVTISK